MVENIDAEREPVGDMLDAYKAWLKQRGPLGVGAMPERIFFAGWLAARRTPSASIGEHGLAEELAALRAEVLEWLCVSCNTVYPGAPKPGLFCVMCPQCGGTTGPRGIVERRVLERKVADLRAQLARQSQGEQICTLRVERGYYQIFGERDKIIDALSIGEYPLYAAPPLSSEQQAAECVGCEGKPSAENNPCAVCGNAAQAEKGQTNVG